MKIKTEHDFRKAIEQFINRLQSQHVRIIPSRIDMTEPVFHLKYHVSVYVQDDYLNNPLEVGFSQMMNDKFYQDADTIGEDIFGTKPGWNNTRSTGWFIIQGKGG